MIREQIRQIIKSAVSKTKMLEKVKKFEFSIERPRHKKYGDWSTNAALIAAPLIKKNPMDIAQAIEKNIDDTKGFLDKVQIAPPGFINMFFKKDWYYQVIERIEDLDEKFGELDIGKGQKVLLEYVSANPVGPLHLGHGRWAAVGDTLANVLRKASYDLKTEFYVNNYGLQIEIFTASVKAAAMEKLGRKVQWPENAYRGKYIHSIAGSLLYHYGPEIIEQEDELRNKAYMTELEEIKATLKKAKVSFDNYFEESTLHENKNIEDIISSLLKKKEAYKKDEALWLNTSKHGDEKDRVLVRSNNESTYFAADIAYHQNKLERGFDKLINIWGADHHGYVARVRAAIIALGEDPKKLEIILGQLVNLKKGSKPVKMSKRTGELITLDDLIDEVGVDALRYTFLTKSTDTTLDFDIDLVKEQSDKNPVYYVQYAHARICSILKFAKEKRLKYKGVKDVNLKLLKEEGEIDLIKVLEEFEEIVEKIALNLTPHLLTTYANKLATSFHYFYSKIRVISEDNNLSQARLALLNTAHITLRNVLSLLGVSAPEKM